MTPYFAGPRTGTILIVEDEATIRHVLHDTLGEQGFTIVPAGSAEEALELLDKVEPDVALLDVVLPGMSGIQLLERIKDRYADTEVVIMTSHASVETAVEAIREGAYDYLQKPFEDLEQITIVVARALEKRHLALNNRQLVGEQEQRNRELGAAVARLSSLIDVGRAMGELQSLEEILNFFTTLIGRDLDVERVSLMLVDETKKALRVVASQGIDEIDVSTVRVPFGEGIAGSVARTGKPFLVTDTQTDTRIGTNANPNLSDSFISAPIVLSIPIKVRQRVLGVINVTNRRSGLAFDEEDLAYLTGMCGQLAVAVDRASQFEELSEAYESLKSARDQLVFSERIKAVGQMAAGVAHDFNNVLSVILARTQLVQRQLALPEIDVPRIREDMETIKRISLQSAETIKRIQDYTRIRRDVPQEAADMNMVVTDAVEMTRPKWKGEWETEGRRIEVEHELGDIPPISGNVHELTQVVGNLIFNAVEAMPNGGRLHFKTYTDDDCVCLEVSDTGVGMDEQTRERLFEPFFTTKDDGHGLGTSIIYGIIARHGGEITVASDPGIGTTFLIRVPRGHAIPRNEEPAPVRHGAVHGSRVLLVEDDDMVRETYAEALADAGHQVEACTSGAQATRLFSPDRFDIVLTDLSMAGMSGLDVAKNLKNVDPSIPVILVSGWAIQQDNDKVRDAGIDRVLAKPCLIEDLLAAVHQAARRP